MVLFPSAVVALTTIVAFTHALYDASSPVISLTDKNFNDVKKGLWLVEFYAPWCGHCKAASADYSKAAKALQGIVKVGAVDMTVYQSLGAPYKVEGFPTFKIFSDGVVSDYNGQRTAQGFVDAATALVTKTIKTRMSGGGGQQQQQQQQKSSSKSSSGSSNSGTGGGAGGTVEELTDSNFDDVVLNNANDLIIVSFTAPWCGHCVKLKPEFKEAAKLLGANSGIRLMNIDATANQQAASRFKVQGFPTIKAFAPGPKSDSAAVDYQGPREAQGIVEWATNFFQQHGGKVVVEVAEITSQSAFEATCGANKKCVVAFLPDILDSTAKEREQYIETIKGAASKMRHMPFVWIAANAQPQYESAYDLRSGFPAVVLLREVDGQKVGFNHRGKLTEEALVSFASAPRGMSTAIKGGWPIIVKTKPWDGKDAPKPAATPDDDFDVEAFLKSQA